MRAAAPWLSLGLRLVAHNVHDRRPAHSTQQQHAKGPAELKAGSLGCCAWDTGPHSTQLSESARSSGAWNPA